MIWYFMVVSYLGGPQVISQEWEPESSYSKKGLARQWLEKHPGGMDQKEPAIEWMFLESVWKTWTIEWRTFYYGWSSVSNY